jgi:putative membrane protein
MESMRDKLALERTRLANERTFLAYVRTSLSLIAGAAVIFQFFSNASTYVAFGWLLAASGIVVLIVGIYRFRTVRSYLKDALSARQTP